MAATVYEFEAVDIGGSPVSLEDYKGDVLLVVNVASKCGMTPQYEGLQKLYEEFADDGFKVLGFPCNQFGGQEPGSEDEIKEFCSVNYGATFPMFSKIKVNGDDTHPLYTFLKSEAPGIMKTKAIKWNFTKFLIDREGKVVKRFGPKTPPKDFRDEIAELVASN